MYTLYTLYPIYETCIHCILYMFQNIDSSHIVLISKPSVRSVWCDTCETGVINVHNIYHTVYIEECIPYSIHRGFIYAYNVYRYRGLHVHVNIFYTFSNWWPSEKVESPTFWPFCLIRGSFHPHPNPTNDTNTKYKLVHKYKIQSKIQIYAEQLHRLPLEPLQQLCCTDGLGLSSVQATTALLSRYN